MQQTSECKYNILLQLYTCKRPMTIARTVADEVLILIVLYKFIHNKSHIYEGKKALLLF